MDHDSLQSECDRLPASCSEKFDLPNSKLVGSEKAHHPRLSEDKRAVQRYGIPRVRSFREQPFKGLLTRSNQSITFGRPQICQENRFARKFIVLLSFGVNQTDKEAIDLQDRSIQLTRRGNRLTIMLIVIMSVAILFF